MCCLLSLSDLSAWAAFMGVKMNVNDEARRFPRLELRRAEVETLT